VVDLLLLIYLFLLIGALVCSAWRSPNWF